MERMEAGQQCNSPLMQGARYLLIVNPLFILAVGMVVVIGGILVLRLHAFLALLAGAFTVAFLTGPDAIMAWGLEGGMSVAEAEEAAGKNFSQRVAMGFGIGCSKVGIVIAMAAIIGKCLLDSGGAERIVLALRRAFGEERTPAAFTVSGFVLGIPVFFDTVFYLLMPLGKALRMKTGKNYLLYVLTIVAGATMAHSLVPPTPGPLAVAEELGIDIGVMMLGGCGVGIFTIAAGYAYACWANRRWEIPLRPSDELSEGELEAMANRDEGELPSLMFALLPILIPVILIAGNTIGKALGTDLPKWMAVLGDKNIALSLAAGVAMILLAVQKRMSLRNLREPIQAALTSGALIILVTAAGSAFGLVLGQTGIAGTLRGSLPDSALLLILIAFGVTSLIRIAQGSATVAMITAAGMVGPVISAIDLPYHPIYIALAIGCGSKPIMWMNDSGFWIITKMSGMKEGETLKTASAMMVVMAVAGLAVVLLGAVFLPLVKG
jgi:GntP family gluconate:H+ symporter